MTEQQFQYNVNKNTIEYDGKFVAYVNCVDGVRIANKLNELAKNDDVYHKRVINLIDDRISYFSDVKMEIFLHSDDDYRLEKLSFAIQCLRELREELEE